MIIKKNLVFVEYNGEFPPCTKCALADGPEDVCDRYPCRSFERADGKNGFYRLCNANAVAYGVLEGGEK